MITEIEATVGVEAFRELRSRFRGALIKPGDEAYAEARRVWNGAIDRRPALIARCVDADDVATVLRFCKRAGTAHFGTRQWVRSHRSRSG